MSPATHPMSADMPAATPTPTAVTVDAFLDRPRQDDRSYELIHGEIVARAPTLVSPQIISGHLVRRISEALDARPACSLRVEAAITLPSRDDSCYVADLAVACGGYDPGARTTPDPVLIVEILSPSTEKHDRRVKLPDYRTIGSVQEIVLIDQDQLHCEVHRRLDEERWLVDLVRGRDAVLRLESCGLEQPLAALYTHIALDEEPEQEPSSREADGP